MGQWKHRLTEIDTDNRTANCASCGVVRIKRKAGVRWRCSKAHRSPYKSGITKKAPRLPGACPICGSVSLLVWDHDHTTGKFRAYICRLCNTGLGMFRDNTDVLQKAIEYLKATR